MGGHNERKLAEKYFVILLLQLGTANYIQLVHNITATNGTNHTTFNQKSYQHAAYSYITFYTLGVVAASGYWLYFCKKKKFLKG